MLMVSNQSQKEPERSSSAATTAQGVATINRLAPVERRAHVARIGARRAPLHCRVVVSLEAEMLAFIRTGLDHHAGTCPLAPRAILLNPGNHELFGWDELWGIPVLADDRVAQPSAAPAGADVTHPRVHFDLDQAGGTKSCPQ